jgi:excisionase family DNA binding protein
MPKRKQDPKAGDEGMVGLDEAAGVLGVSRSTLQRMLKQGNVRGFKVGRQWRFRRSDLDKFGRMSHPSSAGVKVTDLQRIVASLMEQSKVTGDVQFESTPAGFPASEEEAAVEGLLKMLLAAAAQQNASDIHVEPVRDATNVRLRVDGVLHHVVEMPRYAHKPLIVAIKQHAELALDQEQIPQDGRFRFTLDGTECDVRVATLPTIYGESAVMRLLPQVAQLLTLGSPALGMSTTDLERLKRLLHQPCGLLLVAGPSGCGKTSLLYAGLQHIASPEIKTITIEDPVEFGFPWVTQAPVNVKAGFGFEQAVRATARQDPDVIMIGELRSQSVADMATRLAMTGHLVMSVLHSGSAAGGIWRLLDMGTEPFALAESLICLVSMRLVRRVCERCGASDQPNSAVLAPLIERARVGGYELPESPNFRRGAGCDACRTTGYYGRTAIYEVMEVTPDIGRLIAARAPVDALRETAVRGGMTTLTADGLRKAAEGITSLAEVARLLPEEPS